MADFLVPRLLNVDDIGYVKVPSPLGDIFVAVTKKGICRISFEKKEFLRFVREAQEELGMRVFPIPGLPKVVEHVLKNYFKGKVLPPGLPLDLRVGTKFMQQVWRALQTIPHGQTRSYGCVAQKIGRSKAFRTVGGTCGANPVPIVVPCHRVVCSNGDLGGFTGRLSIKRRLLRLEGAII